MRFARTDSPRCQYGFHKMRTYIRLFYTTFIFGNPTRESTCSRFIFSVDYEPVDQFSPGPTVFLQMAFTAIQKTFQVFLKIISKLLKN